MSVVSKKRMDILIPLAIGVIENLHSQFFKEKAEMKVKDKEGKEVKIKVDAISKTIHGYFSAFGADMANTTPLAAAIFYEQEDSNSEKDRTLVPKSILNLLKLEPGVNSGVISYSNLQSYIYSTQLNGVPHPHSRAQKALHIAAAAAALKIALRTFPKA